MLTEAGVDLATIMARVGPDDEKTTLKIYTHVTKKIKKNASESESSLRKHSCPATISYNAFCPIIGVTHAIIVGVTQVSKEETAISTAAMASVRPV